MIDRARQSSDQSEALKHSCEIGLSWPFIACSNCALLIIGQADSRDNLLSTFSFGQVWSILPKITILSRDSISV
jgi:hypothetical protein